MPTEVPDVIMSNLPSEGHRVRPAQPLISPCTDRGTANQFQPSALPVVFQLHVFR